AKRGARLPALDWAASRFELGAERASLIEALSDYLLALRGLLEGGGRTNSALAARVATLACEPEEREAGRLCVERALLLERKLMSGGRFRPSAEASPLDVIAELEELLRRVLKGLATGGLEGDLRAEADEILLKQGLAAGMTEATGTGETAEWRLPDPVADDELDLSAVADGQGGGIEVRREADADTAETEPDIGAADEASWTPVQRQRPTRIVVDDVELPEIMAADNERPEAPRSGPFEPDPDPEADWFAAGDGSGEVEWPAFASPRRDRDRDEDRQHGSDRVRYLFPVPDQTDWDVGELRYERRKRSG
ncbi:MAG: hypothetical protein ACRDL6_03010, partial [Solirubrobacterales bacterium]